MPRNRLRRGLPFRLTVLGLLSLIGVLVLSACGGGDPAPASAPPNAGDGATPAEAPVEYDFEVPNFGIAAYQQAAALGGEETTLHDVIAQGKPVVLNFWAGLCPPCRAEMPDLQEVYDARSDEILLIGIDIGPFQSLGTRQNGIALLTELEITYPAGTTFDGSVVRDFQVFGMPSTVFITPDGVVDNQWTGLLTGGKMNELIDDLLDAS